MCGPNSLEWKVQHRLQHPIIVKLHDVQHSTPNVCLILSIADTDLQHIIETRRTDPDTFPLSMRWPLCSETASALHYLHEEVRVLHRDLKPNNILVVFGERPKPLIADFGLVAYREVRTQKDNDQAPSPEPRTAKVCTSGYVPPELLEKRDLATAFYDKEVDVWSLGVIAFEVACFEYFLCLLYTSPSPRDRG